MKFEGSRSESRRGTTTVAVCAGFLLGAGFLWVPGAVAEAGSAETSGTLSVLAGGAIVDDDDAAFQQRNGVPAEAWGGIERLQLDRELGEGQTMTFNGRALADRHDYLADLHLESEDVGFLDLGYEEYRSWSDGSGGFFSTGSGVLAPDLFNEELGLDRGKGWLRTGLRKPGLPELTLSYRYQSRDGRQDSLARGDVSTDFGVKKIAGAFTEVDEERHTVDVEVVAHGDEGSVGAGVRYDHSDVGNSLNMTLRPGEVGLERRTTQDNSIENDTFSARAFGQASLNDDRMMISGMYSYSDIDSDTAGSRIVGAVFGADFDPTFANRQAFDRGFLRQDGDSDLSRHALGASGTYLIHDDLRMLLEARVEADDSESNSTFTETRVGPQLGLPTSQTNSSIRSDNENLGLTQRFELRYTGIESVSLYTRAELEEDQGDIIESQRNADQDVVTLARNTDIDTFAQRYSVGGLWYPGGGWNLASEYAYSSRDSDFHHQYDVGSPNDPGDSNNIGSLNRYPAYLTAQDKNAHEWMARAGFRPRSDLRLGLRYSFEIADYDSEVADLSDRQTSENTTHRVSATSTWTPVSYAYVQSELNYVDSSTDTVLDELDLAAQGLVADFDNDYWNGRLSSGLALDPQTKLDVVYSIVSANNFDSPSDAAQAYGTDLLEHSIILGLERRVSENLLLRGKYGYINSEGDSEGGQNDYDASIVQAGVEIGF